jgi:hypothetical protein
VIAAVLLIGLAILAGATVYYIVVSFIESSTSHSEVIIENVGVADKSDNDLGDYLKIKTHNFGPSKNTVNGIKVEIDGLVTDNWVLGSSNYDLGIGITEIIAFTDKSVSMITSNNLVKILLTLGDDPVTDQYTVRVPSILSAIAVYYESPESFTAQDLAAQGWTEHTLATHGGGGSGQWVVENGNTIRVDTNYDELFILENNDYSITNFIITSTVGYDDDDMIGYIFRYQDLSNYYWVGYTDWPSPEGNPHSTPQNDQHNAGANGIPYAPQAGRWVIGKVVNGVSSAIQIASSTAPVLTRSTTPNHELMLAVSDDTFTLELDSVTVFTVTDTDITNAGYIGLMSIAAQDSTFADLIIQR